MKVLLDTNFLLAIEQRHLDLGALDSHELLVLESVFFEIVKISQSKKKSSAAAKVALKLIEKFGIKTVPSKGVADRALLEYASKEGCIIATLDRELRKAARKKGIPTIAVVKGQIRQT